MTLSCYMHKCRIYLCAISKIGHFLPFLTEKCWLCLPPALILTHDPPAAFVCFSSVSREIWCSEGTSSSPINYRRSGRYTIDTILSASYNSVFICCQPPLFSSHCFRPRGPGFDSRRYQIFWELVGLERGPLGPREVKWEAIWNKKLQALV
jgi:hypothetical protein